MFDGFKDNALAYADLITAIIDSFKTIICDIWKLSVYDAKIVTTAVESAALSLAGLFLAMEVITIVSDFRFERLEDAIRLAIKVIFAKIIIENSSSIIGMIYELFRDLGVSSIESGFAKISGSIPSIVDTITNATIAGPLGVGYIFVCILMLIVVLIIVCMLIMLTIEVMGIIFEIGIHQAVGPIAIATLCNSTARSTGISFIKSYSAVCLQTTVIGAIFTVYTFFADKFIVNVGDKISGLGAFGIIFNFLTPVISLAVLCVTVKKSSDLTKRMFGA